jgi:hypothetical protein
MSDGYRAELWRVGADSAVVIRPANGRRQFGNRELQTHVGGAFSITDLEDESPGNCRRVGLPLGTIFVFRDSPNGLEVNEHIERRFGRPYRGTVLICPGRSVPRYAEAEQMLTFAASLAVGRQDTHVRRVCDLLSAMRVSGSLPRKDAETQT